MSKLTIRFAGICTHFRYGIAPGVPHRVVLPDATRFTTDLLTVEESLLAEPVLYYLLPHFAQLEVPSPDGGQRRLDVDSFQSDGGWAVKDGDILEGVRLQVINAVDDDPLNYPGDDGEDDHTAKLTDFVPNYAYSSDVVLSGRAMCYFDVFSGTVSSIVTKHGATQTQIEMTTDGPPELLVTPLAYSDKTFGSARLVLGEDPEAEVTLFVKNLDAVDSEHSLAHQGGAFDFLLHYLTARGGIPRSILKVTPGMGEPQLISATKKNLADALAGLAALLRPHTRRTLAVPNEVTPSCSDSRYP